MISNDCRCPGCGNCGAEIAVERLTKEREDLVKSLRKARKSLREAKQKYAELSRMNESYIKNLQAAERERDEARAQVKAWQAEELSRRTERDEARAELKKTEDDFQSVFDSRDEVIRERERARQACNTYWHDLTRIALLCAQTDDEYPLKAVERTVRERDEARAEVERLRALRETVRGA